MQKLIKVTGDKSEYLKEIRSKIQRVQENAENFTIFKNEVKEKYTKQKPNLFTLKLSKY